MTIKQQGGVFGRNPTFNDVEAQTIEVTDISLPDSGEASFGNSNDLKIYHNGSNSFIQENGVGSLLIYGSNMRLGNSDGSKLYLLANSGDKTDIYFDGAVKIRTQSTGAQIFGDLAFSSGNGIDFSATAGTGTSELFDDYEEGEWTPTIEGSTTAGTQTYNAQVAKYTKVGRTVTIYAYVSITVKDAAMAGNVRIGGLPYASDGTANALQALALGDYQGVTFGASKTQMMLRIPNNVTKINVYDGGSGLASAQIPVSDINNATYFVVGGTYQTA